MVVPTNDESSLSQIMQSPELAAQLASRLGATDVAIRNVQVRSPGGGFRTVDTPGGASEKDGMKWWVILSYGIGGFVVCSCGYVVCSSVFLTLSFMSSGRSGHVGSEDKRQIFAASNAPVATETQHKRISDATWEISALEFTDEDFADQGWPDGERAA